MLTKIEIAALKTIASSQYWDGDIRAGGLGVWSDGLHEFGPLSGKVFSGACASLQKKGLVECQEKTVSFTEAGLEALKEGK